MRKVLGMAVAVATLAAGPASAGCWTASEMAAAKVRSLDTMLMVSALRCRTEAPELVAKYNAVVAHHRVPLTEANDRIRTHFAAGVTPREAVAAYDTFVTRLANRYGAGAEGVSCASLIGIADAVAGEIADLEGLLAAAARAEIAPDLGEAACDLPVVAPLAAAPPAPAVVAAAGLETAPATVSPVSTPVVLTGVQ